MTFDVAHEARLTDWPSICMEQKIQGVSGCCGLLAAVQSMRLQLSPPLKFMVLLVDHPFSCYPAFRPAYLTCYCRSLVLENCMELAEARIGGNSLELLNLAGCKGLRTLELSAPSLQRLQLEECEHLTSVVANAIGVPRLALGTCPRLLRLHVQSANLHRLDLMYAPPLAPSCQHTTKIVTL